jgi:hypothetical protein
MNKQWYLILDTSGTFVQEYSDMEKIFLKYHTCVIDGSVDVITSTSDGQFAQLSGSSLESLTWVNVHPEY